MTFARGLVAALLACAAALTAHAQQRLLADRSEIAFTSRQMGVPVSGHFRAFDAEIQFDPQRPEAAKIKIGIDMGSVTLASREAQDELAQPGWFDSRRWPRASFVSSTVKPLGGGRFEVAGRLKIKDAARDIVVPVTLAATEGATAATGSFTLHRLDFKIGDGEWGDTSLVADSVQVRFRLLLAGVAAP